MIPGLTNTRRLGKVEKPRPLKMSSTLGDQSMECVLTEMDLVSQKLNGTTIDRSVLGVIASLCENLKVFGHQLESLYKDQLDRCYVSLRNGCRDDRLTLASRYRLLEVIELRAMNWQPNENLINYYKQKLALIESDEVSLEEPSVEYLVPGGGTAPVFGGAQFPIYPQQILFAPQQQQQPPTVVAPPPTTPPTLGPGELLKASGKFAKPMRIPGKNYSKDEVVIRNADSGKVMGLKGRRVHMIEELSETIISFQRVAPGARERLVQITGPTDDNINHAKQLIEETIRRNASPVRCEDRDSVFTSLGGSSSSISSHTSDDLIHGVKRVSLGAAPLDEALSEFRYTVVHDNDAIRITGTNLDLVRTAKIILDEYFNGEQNLNFSSSPESMDTSVSTPRVSTCSPTSCASSSQGVSARGLSPPAEGTKTPEKPPSEEGPKTVTVVRQPLIPSSTKEAVETAENDASEVTKIRRKLFAKTSDERQSSVTYSREFLVMCAASPLSQKTPHNWAQVVKQFPFVVKKNFQFLQGLLVKINDKGEAAVNGVNTYLSDSDLVTPKTHLGMDPHWSLLRGASVQDDDDQTNGNA